MAAKPKKESAPGGLGTIAAARNPVALGSAATARA
jgi:hypothetical protein